MLEESLDKIDSQEDRALFLGSARRDANTSRKDVIEKLTKALPEYDVLLEQNQRALMLPRAQSRDVKNLQKWVKGTASISRREFAYLEQGEDVVNLTGASDSALALIEDTVGDAIFFIGRCFRRIFPAACTKRKHALTA
ncbi:hypothetical protein CC86DRAFT_374406 [Ophiobolus disseminans]|uniref:DUF6594 domain-containing protein n=1 Tax=Ophiobolus disseminans TaxID=1469910 RepID=A0A6A6ZHF8_9PLEO|nr:hypothetical protein CC86DRAFT_374406 [Ophiobolus disseminans]